ncbi:MAG: hypothetical protein ABSC94_15775 [Polyangiaceae bacterium]
MQHASRFDPDSLDEGAVSTVQITDPNPFVARLDLGVYAGYRRVDDDDVAVRCGAEDTPTIEGRASGFVAL